MCSEIWILGQVKTAPRHISVFVFYLMFYENPKSIFESVVPIIHSTSTFNTLFLWECYRNALPVSGVPQHCAAGGNCLRRFGRFRKSTPWFFEHVSCGFGQYLENFVVIRTGETRVQGLGEPAGARRGNRWVAQPEGIPY